MSRVKFTYVDINGDERVVEGTPGETLMEVATAHSIAGIDGDCGGCCACGTCRTQFDATLFAELGQQQQDELDLLEFVESEKEHVRLGCQVEVSARLEGARLTVAT